MENSRTEENSLFQVMTGSFGFLIVALLAAITGYVLSSHLTISSLQKPEVYGTLFKNLRNIGVFLLMLWPYFYCRQALLERRKTTPSPIKYDYWAKNVGLAPFVLLQIYSFVITLLVIVEPATVDPNNQWLIMFGSIFTCLIPFFILIGFSVSKLKNPDDSSEFHFIERVFVPGLATGIIPFSFGWAIGKPENIWGIISGTGYIILLVILANVLKGSRRLIVPVLGFIICVIAKIIIHTNFFDNIIYGTLITFSLGVSETVKRYYQAEHDMIYFVEQNPREYYLGGANWSSVVFPAFLVLVPLLFNELPTWPLMLFISFQSLVWLGIKPKYKGTYFAPIFAYLTGYGLLLLIIATQFFQLHTVVFPTVSIPISTTVGSTALILALGGAFFLNILKIGDRVLLFFKNIDSYKNYLTEENPYFLFIFMVTLTILVVSFIGEFFTTNELVREKAVEINIFLDIMLIAAGIMLTFKSKKDLKTMEMEAESQVRKETIANPETKKEKDPESETDKEKKIGLRKFFMSFKQIIVTSRPTTSFVSGFTTLIFLIIDKRFPIWIDLLQALPIALVTMAGFIANDIYDYDQDLRSRLNRPIAKGQISRKSAFIYLLIFCLLAILIEVIFTNQMSPLIVVLLTLTGVILYSPFKKDYPFVKGFYTSLLTISPVIFAQSIINIHIPYYLYLAAFIYNVGREILTDSDDFERDRKSGLKTVVYYLGHGVSRKLGWSLMFVGVIYLLINMNSTIPFLLTTAGLLTLGLGLFFEFRHTIRHDFLTKITMLLCVLAFPFML